jgi:hypothetical protein
MRYPLSKDLVCKIPHHNVFATYNIDIYGLFYGREVLHIPISLWVVKMMIGTRRMFVKMETTPKVRCW